MVLNITRPITSATFPAIATRREQAMSVGYDDGKHDAEGKFNGMSKTEILAEVKSCDEGLEITRRPRKDTPSILRSWTA